ncbi:MAG TPA: hypothetical protein PK926_02230 [Spirochaetota bacterium]|nr:hypothetical protein [Spirochaetota bacterium]HPI88931.1 hypothetical protein [Spirochaetota bacterium]HPR46592.1 hypothetical protein [Spirochaetota bacterium]
MKRAIFTSLLILVFAAVYAARYSPHKRMYKNEVPALRIIGVAMSENMANAKYVVEDLARKKTGLGLSFPIFVEENCSMKGSAFSVEMGGRTSDDTGLIGSVEAWDATAGGNTFYSKIAELYKINREQAVTLIFIDRKGVIRGIANTYQQIRPVSDNKYAEFLEYLLLNLNGNEEMPYDLKKMKTKELVNYIDGNQGDSLHILEFGNELKERQQKKKDVIKILSGNYQSRIYPLLGQQAPDFTLPLLDNSGKKSFRSMTKGQVTVLVVFWAGGSQSDPTSLMTTSMGLAQMYGIDNLYKDWAEKQAKPGRKDNESAKP